MPAAELPPQVRPLRPDVAAALRRIEPTGAEPGLLLYPCEAALDDGTVVPRVYVAEAAGYLREWGVWPWNDRGKGWVPADRVVSLRSSPLRLPPRFAAVVDAAGESGMGYCAYSLTLHDGRTLYFVTGNAVDFPHWPEGVTPDDVASVRPHDRCPEHRHRPPREHESGAPYVWCLFRPG